MNRLNKPRLSLALALLLTLTLHETVWAATSQTLTLVKNKGCVCCERWAADMKAHGFAVKTVEMADVTPFKDQQHVPVALRSCHTATIGGYVIEGHVPADLIRKLLKDKPHLAGLASPGMPPSAPGMDLPGKPVPYQVMAFGADGKTTLYAQR
ncbi:DUF411 domain-containing protein [Paludibacterium sp. THUN1379]|uniref:DUF411 domain-containing protein n=1 Tax=Paludibacterium sp. THUN1379 TaxID=3112107 RepID=UPI00308D4B24|nr:DUF411 domain-containing protein [Paludibacterium sp. THUN1379]